MIIFRQSSPQFYLQRDQMEHKQPKFLTHDLAESVIKSVLDLLFDGLWMSQFPKRKALHVVVMVPYFVSDGRVLPHTLIEHSYGNKSEWPWPFDEIARSKAQQLWDGRNFGGTDVKPHLMVVGDAPYWGGVRRDGIVVACSGIQPWLDRMVSGMIADTLIGLSYEAWDKSDDKKEEVNALT